MARVASCPKPPLHSPFARALLALPEPKVSLFAGRAQQDHGQGQLPGLRSHSQGPALFSI